MIGWGCIFDLISSKKIITDSGQWGIGWLETLCFWSSGAFTRTEQLSKSQLLTWLLRQKQLHMGPKICFNGCLNFPNTVHLTFTSKATDVPNEESRGDTSAEQRSCSLLNSFEWEINFILTRNTKCSTQSQPKRCL